MSSSKIHFCYIIISTEFKEKPTLGQDELFCCVIISFPSGSDSKESACNAGDLGSSLGWEDPLEKGMATPSSVLAWRIPQTEEPGGLPSTESDTSQPASL